MIAAVMLLASQPLPPPARRADPEYWPTIIFFDGESATLDRQARLVLRSFLAERNAIAPHCAISIKGFSDNPAFEPDGKTLSLKRAQAVKAAFVRWRVYAPSIVIEAIGADQPLVDDHGRQPQPQNRMAEIAEAAPCE